MSYLPRAHKGVAKTETWTITTEPASSVFSRLRRRTRFSAVAKGVRTKPNQRAEDKNNYGDFYLDDTIMEITARLGGEWLGHDEGVYGETREEAEHKMRKHICEMLKAHAKFEDMEQDRKRSTTIDAEDICIEDDGMELER